VLLGVGALVGASCSTDATSPSGTSLNPSTSSIRASTTSESVSVPATSVVDTAAPPASTAPPDERFDPPCIDRSSTDVVIEADDPALDVFGPLGAEPVVQLELPRFPGGAINDWSRADVRRVRGGMFVSVRPYNGSPEPLGAMVVVDRDGSLRWQRCLDPMPDVVLVPDGGDGDEFVVGWSTYTAAGLVDARFEIWSLIDGRPSRTWDELLAAQRVSGEPAAYRDTRYRDDGSVWVLGPTAGDRVVSPTDSLLVVDLATMAMRVLAYPVAELGLPLDLLQLGTVDDGRLVALGRGPGPPGATIDAVEVDGSWSTAADDIEAVAPIRADFDYSSERHALVAADARGVEIWRRDDLLAIPAEGFHVATDGDVVLAAACSDVPDLAGDWCPGRRFLAVDLGSGRTLWERAGAWSASVLGDGKAMVAGPFTATATTATDPAPPPVPWTMIDLASGSTVGDRVWTIPWHFGIGCCDEPQRATRSGGVVFTMDENTVEMWYPQQLTTGMQPVVLD
jgi:hypothetical protein